MGRKNSILKFVLLFSGIYFLLQNASGQTSLPSSITQNFTASRSNSPYVANQDVTVSSSAVFTVEAGVEIQFASNAGLYIHGGLKMMGTKNQPIKLNPKSGSNFWEVISIIESDHNCELNYVTIRGSTEGDNSDRDRSAISARKSNVVIDHCDIRNGENPIFLSYCKDALISNCIFHSTVQGDYVNFLESNGTIENCEFIGNATSNTDAIDFDGSQGIIRGNYLHDFVGYNTDAIDIGGDATIATIENNRLENINDKGISIGEEARAEVNFNLIIRASTGIASKDLSVVNASNNTLVQVNTSYAAFSREGVELGGGFLYIKNSIIVESGSPISSLDNSTVTIRYSLCDNMSLSGTGNLRTDPLFTDPDNGVYTLLSNSPAIDAGDPNDPLDSDGSRADMGAFSYSTSSNIGIVISELHYNPYVESDESVEYEFIELTNTTSSEINLSGFRFDRGVNYVFPSGSSIDPGEYILLVKYANNYLSVNGQVFQWWDGDLDDMGETIRMIGNNDEAVLELTYASTPPWPVIAGGSNRTIQLINLQKFSSNGANWRLSEHAGGSPGESDEKLVVGLYINEILSKSTEKFPDDFGDPSDWIEIYNSSSQTINLGGLFISKETDNPGFYEIPVSQSTSVPSGGYLVLYASDNSAKGDLHLPFTLSSAGEEIGIYQLFDGSYQSIDHVVFPQMVDGQSYGRIPDGSSGFQISELPSPGSSNEGMTIDDYNNLVINEFVAKSNSTYPDEHGQFSDWIEIYNSGEESVNLGGLFLSDRISDPKHHEIPNGLGDSTSIDPGGFLVFRADALTKLGFNHLNFELASGGEEVILSAEIDGELILIDHIVYSAQSSGKSYGRLGDGADTWVYFGTPTPGNPNSTTSVRPYGLNEAELKVFPNPVRTFLSIEVGSDLSSIEFIEIIDIQGIRRKIWRTNELTPTLLWDLRSRKYNLVPGIYFVHQFRSGKSFFSRFIVM